MARELETDWFAGAEKGCGTGRAISWQGWRASDFYTLVVAASVPWVERTILAFAAILIVTAAALLVVCDAKTRGRPALALLQGGGMMFMAIHARRGHRFCLAALFAGLLALGCLVVLLG